MLKLPDYLICQNTALPGAGLILSTLPPFFFGKVWRFDSDAECADFISKCVNSRESKVYCKVDGYRIVICLAGALDNANTGLYKGKQQAIVDGMCQLYHEQKILAKLGFYRKYKEE
jgi:hypothetical protein